MLRRRYGSFKVTIIDMFFSTHIPFIVHYIMQAAIAKLQVKEAKHETWRENQASRVLIQERERDVLDQLEEAQVMMDDAIREEKASYEAKMEAQMECLEQSERIGARGGARSRIVLTRRRNALST